MKDSPQEFERFFLSKKLASTYKPFFLKCCLDLTDAPNVEGSQWVSDYGDSIEVDLNFIAVRFLWFYWILHFKFKLKQSPTKEITVYRLLDDNKEIFGKNKTQPSKEDLCSDKFQKLRLDIIRQSIRPEVLFKLLNDCDVYSVTKEKKSIIISKKIIEFMKCNRKILECALNNIISEFLEKFNRAPKIASKLEEKQPRITLKTTEFEQLIKIQNNMCFYCKREFKSFVQEHFVPWNYLFDTQSYNIVPSCKNCNSSKNDKLPDEDFLRDILRRNKILKKLPYGYSDDWFKNVFDSCRVEYHGNASLWKPKL